jgi:hypothetical protein
MAHELVSIKRFLPTQGSVGSPELFGIEESERKSRGFLAECPA